MYNREMFIKYINLDDQNRILISVQNHFEDKLKEANTKTEIKKIMTEVLGDNLEKLEIGKNVLRVTVTENPDESISKINAYIDQMLQMAAQFMDQMGKETNEK
ncbi:hypothetical protein QUF55_09670 [Clostridiaceae bacterium HSG29]|nr:hypothetical protein [Clostridiaceae bacterium HSG29]